MKLGIGAAFLDEEAFEREELELDETDFLEEECAACGRPARFCVCDAGHDAWAEGEPRRYQRR